MSRLPSFEVKTSISGKLDTETVVVFQDAGKKAIPPKGRYGTWVERLRKSAIFTGKHGSSQFIRFSEQEPAENVLFVGLGPVSELTEEKARVAGGNAWNKLAAEKSTLVSVDVESFMDSKNLKWIRAFAEGLVLAAYEFNKYRSKANGAEDHNKPSKIIFHSRQKGDLAPLEKELSQVVSMAESVFITRDWSNEPSNFGTPTYFANEAKRLAKEHKLKITVLNERDAQREKMGLFLGVGQGSERESRLVVVEYTPKNIKKPKTVALVGKGVTFDSGGISIKAAARMEEMKHDMTGAATVLGATLLAAKWKVPTRVIAVMAFVENMPDGNAIQPGNVLRARNGKTVEVINTDAEGRLVLADALDFVQDFKPDAVIDVATLTGAVSIALGKHCCGILGNDATLIEALQRAGDSQGERIWQLPMFDEYFEDLKSDCADMKNSANDSNGGTIRGAQFLKQFIRKDVAWAHLDIAATAYNISHLSYCPKRGGSGAYVRSLASFIADF